MQATTNQSPFKQFNHDHWLMLSRSSAAAAEAYRKEVTTPCARSQSTTKQIFEREGMLEKGEQLVSTQVVDTIPEIQVAGEENPQTIVEETAIGLTREEIVNKLKEKGVKGVHMIKSDEKLIEKARQHGLLP